MAQTKSRRTAPAKDHRIDARIDAETDARLARAAEITHETVSSFVARAVRAETDKVLGRADVTLMDAELFDSLMDSLDAPEPAPALSKLASRPRSYRSV